MPSLDTDDLEKSEQRVSEHTVRKTTTSRDNGELPTLTGQQYEPDVNIVVRYDESVTTSGEKLGTPTTTVDPLSDEFDLVREFDLESIESELNSVFLEFPTRATLSLPPVLRNVEIVWSSAQEDGNYVSTGSVPITGLGSGSVSETGSASCSATVRPEFIIEMEDVYANNIPTTSYIFFLKYPVTLSDILTKVNALQWPVFRPRSHTIVATGESRSVRVAASGSYSISGVKELTDPVAGSYGKVYLISRTNGEGYSGKVEEIVTTASIPPSLNGGIFVQQRNSNTATGTATINFNWGGGVSANENRSANATGSYAGGLTSTSPPDIPRSGRYLIDSKVDLYQYGFARVYAEVLDASIFSLPTS
jgi:hypothetical protein